MNIKIEHYLVWKLGYKTDYDYSLSRYYSDRNRLLSHAHPDYAWLAKSGLYSDGLSQEEVDEVRISDLDFDNSVVSIKRGDICMSYTTAEDIKSYLGTIKTNSNAIFNQTKFYGEKPRTYMKARAIRLLENGGSVDDLVEKFGIENVDYLFQVAGLSELSKGFAQNFVEISDFDYDLEDFFD